MNQRFQNEEISRVAEKYAGNELYQAICTIGQQLESELTEFGLCPEECFMETLELLSVIAVKGEDILPDVENMWLRKSNEYRRFDRHVRDNEISKAVGIVFGFTILAIDSSRHRFYRYVLTERLNQIIARHQFEGWQTTLERIFFVPLPDGWFDAFIEKESAIQELPMPKVINTDRAKTYFQKAINKGYMSIEDGRFFWIGVKKRPSGTPNISELAYFLGKVYEYEHSVSGNNGKKFPEDELNTLFGVRNLYNRLVQAHNAMNIQAWRQPIDDLFQE